jgi:hypothetical protein
MNNQQGKTHYRRILKSDHLGCADLEDFIENGSDLVFTVLNVRQELKAKVAGKKIDANIMYFELKDGKKIKPLVLNATNAKTMKKMTGSGFIEDWAGLNIKLRIDANVSMMGEIVGGVRIHPKAVAMQKPVLNRSNTKVWNNVITAFKSYGNFNKVLEKWVMTQEDMKFISEGVSNGSL